MLCFDKSQISRYWKICFQSLVMKENGKSRLKFFLVIPRNKQKTATLIDDTKLLRLILKNRYVTLSVSTTRILAPIWSILTIWQISKGFCGVKNWFRSRCHILCQKISYRLNNIFLLNFTAQSRCCWQKPTESYTSHGENLESCRHVILLWRSHIVDEA